MARTQVKQVGEDGGNSSDHDDNIGASARSTESDRKLTPQELKERLSMSNDDADSSESDSSGDSALIARTSLKFGVDDTRRRNSHLAMSPKTVRRVSAASASRILQYRLEQQQNQNQGDLLDSEYESSFGYQPHLPSATMTFPDAATSDSDDAQGSPHLPQYEEPPLRGQHGSPHTSSLRASAILRLTRDSEADGTTTCFSRSSSAGSMMSRDDSKSTNQQQLEDQSSPLTDAVNKINCTIDDADSDLVRRGVLVVNGDEQGLNNASSADNLPKNHRPRTNGRGARKNSNLGLTPDEAEQVAGLAQQEALEAVLSSRGLNEQVSANAHRLTKAQLEAKRQALADRALKDSGTTIAASMIPRTSTTGQGADADAVSASVVRLPPPTEASYRIAKNLRKSSEENEQQVAAAAAATRAVSDAFRSTTEDDEVGSAGCDGTSNTADGSRSTRNTRAPTVASSDSTAALASGGEDPVIENRAISMTGAIRVRGINYRHTEDPTRGAEWDSASEHHASEPFSLGDWVDPHPDQDASDRGRRRESFFQRTLKTPIQAERVDSVASEEDGAAKRELQERVDALERQLSNPHNAWAFFGGGPVNSSAVVSATSVQSLADDDDFGGLDASGRSMPPRSSDRQMARRYYDEDKQQRCSIWWWPAGVCCLFITIGAIVAIVAATGKGDDSLVYTKDQESNNNTGAAPALAPVVPSPTLPGNGSISLPTLDIIRQRGFIRCRTEEFEREKGSGFSLDLCRALSAAIFDGDWNRTQFPVVPWGDQWKLIANGELDISTSQATYTMERDIQMGMAFTTPYLYTGLLFAGLPEMVDCAEQGETLAGNCRDLAVCVIAGTTTETSVREHLEGAVTKTVSDSPELISAFMDGSCNVFTDDSTYIILAERNLRDAGYDGDFQYGSTLFSKEPLAMVTRETDPEFGDFCEWILNALITAEAMNITQASANSFPTTALFGPEYESMFIHALGAVGNYGEMYERHIQKLIPRSGMNLINQGDSGLLYSNPFGDISLDDSSVAIISGSMLDSVEARNIVVCGVLADRPWLGIVNDAFSGLDVEFCRALSAAKFGGNSNQLAIVKYDTLEHGFAALDQKIIDVFASVPSTMTIDVHEASTGAGYDLSPPYFYDPLSDSSYVFATRQDDPQWSNFVRWTIWSTIYAEEQGISSEDAADLPTVDLFGPRHVQMFRFINLDLGNYGDMYERTQETLIPRSGRNLLNSGGPILLARPQDFGF